MGKTDDSAKASSAGGISELVKAPHAMREIIHKQEIEIGPAVHRLTCEDWCH